MQFPNGNGRCESFFVIDVTVRGRSLEYNRDAIVFYLEVLGSVWFVYCC